MRGPTDQEKEQPHGSGPRYWDASLERYVHPDEEAALKRARSEGYLEGYFAARAEIKEML